MARAPLREVFIELLWPLHSEPSPSSHPQWAEGVWGGWVLTLSSLGPPLSAQMLDMLVFITWVTKSIKVKSLSILESRY